MARVIAYAEECRGTSPKWSASFAAGCGGKMVYGGPFAKGAPFAFWGSPRLWPFFVDARATAPAWYYGDHAFFGRGQFYRCARNTMQFDGSAGDEDPKRFRGFNIPVRAWRSAGSHILLCPNSEVFFGLHGLSAAEWVTRTIAALRRHTDREIRVRWKVDRAARPLERDLTDCWAVVTFVSNAAVMAVLAGIPAFCTALCAGLTMGCADLSRIETPRMPDGREAWAARLANNQWTLDEMRRGTLWAAIGDR